jgi:hypothetical protein
MAVQVSPLLLETAVPVVAAGSALGVATVVMAVMLVWVVAEAVVLVAMLALAVMGVLELRGVPVRAAVVVVVDHLAVPLPEAALAAGLAYLAKARTVLAGTILKWNNLLGGVVGLAAAAAVSKVVAAAFMAAAGDGHFSLPTPVVAAVAQLESSGPVQLVNSHQLRWDHHNEFFIINDTINI